MEWKAVIAPAMSDEAARVIYNQEAVESPYRTSGGSAGSEVVTFLSQKGTTTVVAGDFGKIMIQAMKGKGMTYLEFKGSAEEAVKKVLQEKK